MSRPKKQKKTVQERKKAAAERQAERQKKDDRMTYIMIGIMLVLFIGIAVKLMFF